MKTTRNKLEQYYGGLDATGNFSGLDYFKFNYALGRNKDRIETELREAAKTMKPNADYIKLEEAYQEERLKLCDKMCVRNEAGDPVMIKMPDGQENFKMSDDSAFNAKLKELDGRHAEFITARKEFKRKREEIMDSEIEFDVFMCELKNVPKDKITGNQLANVVFMLKAEEG